MKGCDAVAIRNITQSGDPDNNVYMKGAKVRGFLQSLTVKIAHWMQGRYGMDSLSNGLVALGIVAMLVSLVPFLGILSWLALLCLALALLRCFSKNVARRRHENDTYKRFIAGPKHAYTLTKKRWVNRKVTLYFKCKGCGQMLSVPRGKGTLRVVCPKCKKETTKKS